MIAAVVGAGVGFSVHGRPNTGGKWCGQGVLSLPSATRGRICSLSLGDVAANLARGAHDLAAFRAPELVEVLGEVIGCRKPQHEAILDAADDQRAPICWTAAIGL